jgi:hypothetical protein
MRKFSTRAAFSRTEDDPCEPPPPLETFSDEFLPQEVSEDRIASPAS